MPGHRLHPGKQKRRHPDIFQDEGGPFIDFVCVLVSAGNFKYDPGVFMSASAPHCSRALCLWLVPTISAHPLAWVELDRYDKWIPLAPVPLSVLVLWITGIVLLVHDKRGGGVRRAFQPLAWQKNHALTVYLQCDWLSEKMMFKIIPS